MQVTPFTPEAHASVMDAARAALTRRDYAEAVAQYRRLIRAEPGEPLWRLRLADAAAALGDHETATASRRALMASSVDAVLALVAALAEAEQAPLPVVPMPYQVTPAPILRSHADLAAILPPDEASAPLPAYRPRPGGGGGAILLATLGEDLELLRDAFSRLSLDAGQLLVEEGSQADALYLIAAGRLEVSKADARRGEVVLATLNPGTVVGEMSLMLNRPRSATVRALTDVELVRLSLVGLNEAAKVHPELADSLRRYTRQRMTSGLIATSPVLGRLGAAARATLLNAFTDRTAEDGEVLIEQDEAANHLFLVVSGEVEVNRQEGHACVPLARLGSGQVIGEMALITGAKASATVFATGEVRLLCLNRETYERVAAQYPELREALAQLSSERLAENRFILQDDEFIEPAD